MESSEIEDVLIQAIRSCEREDGWANLADLGAILRSQGIKYGKLHRFIGDYSHIVETRIDDSVAPPAVYARIKEAG
jgi:hypothetical protein